MSEDAPNDPMDAPNRRRCVGAAWTPDVQEAAIEAVEVCGAEARDLDVSEGMKDRLVEEPPGDVHCPRRETWPCMFDPGFAQCGEGALSWR